MFRFTIKSLIFITAVAAAWALMAREAKNGPTLAGFAGYMMYIGLILWGACGTSYNRKGQDERQNRAREADESNPTN